MKKRWFGYALCLGLAACLYFFENNTGTRTVLICSVLFPALPFFRQSFFSAEEAKKADASKPLTVHSFAYQETDDLGDIRQYRPGDPVRRIHWKLSAKKNELLVRETEKERETVQEESLQASAPKKKAGILPAWLLGCLIVFLLAALFLLPEARLGAQALCNRVFAASEQVNAYAYDYFPVPEGQSILWAAVLIGAAAAALIALMIILRSGSMALCFMAGCTLFQVYFGLSFPAWMNVSLYALLASWMVKGSLTRKRMLSCAAVVLLVFLLVAGLLPGVDVATETASETVRDSLSRISRQITGGISELPEGETETRHAHTLSLQTGGNEAQTDREYRLVTLEEEQISIPRFFNWLKTILLFLLVIAALVLPFTPFLLLNARKKKAEEKRNAFASEDVGEAVRAIFPQVIAWLRETGHDAGNLLYREWADRLPADLPAGYHARFIQCAEDFEEAAYSSHSLPEEKRRHALELLKETELFLWNTADWKQRLRIRYWICLCE